MGTMCVTGSSSGIGAATRLALAAEGHRVIGVDLHDADVVADLATPAGRQAMIEGVTAASGGRLDGLVAGAGVMASDPTTLVSVNYFGAVATVEGLRPLLAAGGGGGAVVISSNSATVMAGVDPGAVAACLNGDEAAARAVFGGVAELAAYPSSKLALARWMRRTAVRPEYVGEGVRLNAVAPGPTTTPMTDSIAGWVLTLGETYPVPIGRMADPAEIAAVLSFLLSPASSYVVGAFIPVDGGGEAAARGEEWPLPR